MSWCFQNPFHLPQLKLDTLFFKLTPTQMPGFQQEQDLLCWQDSLRSSGNGPERHLKVTLLSGHELKKPDERHQQSFIREPLLTSCDYNDLHFWSNTPHFKWFCSVCVELYYLIWFCNQSACFVLCKALCNNSLEMCTRGVLKIFLGSLQVL